jgi:hypothetical protein
MSQVASARYTCENCGKTFVPKPEWMGKKVKCRCGYVMSIPLPPPPKEEPAGDDMYDLAPEAPAAKAKQHAAPPEVVAASVARTAAIPAAGGAAAVASPVLGYRSKPTKVEENRFSSSCSTMLDPKRDMYVPLGLLIGGLLLYVCYYAVAYRLSASGIAVVAVGLSLLTVFKAALMFGFALMIASPLGVSFGGIFTAALKLAAIAIFTDGVTTWIDAGVGKMAGTGGGFFDGMLSFPIAVAIYWILLIYLFSMDAGDSWLVVILLAVFDNIVRWVILMILIGAIMNWGGASGVGAVSVGGGGTKTLSTMSEEDLEWQAAKDAGELEEAVQWGKSHSTMMEKQTAEFYAAGAKGVYFQVSYDINRKPTIHEYVVELPKEKDKREKIFKIRRDYYRARFNDPMPADKDPEGAWMEVSTGMGGF